MFERRSIRGPIILGVTLIVLVVTILIAWVLITVFAAYWALMTVGTLLLVLVLLGVVMYLTLSIKAINLNRRQSNFMDSVTHELKSPIASLKLYLQTLTRRPVSEEQRTKFHEFMLEDIERLDGLINHLLDAARLERDQAEHDLEDLELAGMVRDCAENVCQRHRIAEDVVQLELEPCVIHARRVDAEMVVRNLLDNAVKYARDDDPRVEVTLKALPKNQVLLRISDNGRGIPANLRRKIFGRFVRLGMELERDKPGTGLGLYIVRSLVIKLRGRVRVHEREPGPGTSFEVQLPGHRELDEEPVASPESLPDISRP